MIRRLASLGLAAFLTALCACQPAPPPREPVSAETLSGLDVAPPTRSRSLEASIAVPIADDPEPDDYRGMLDTHNLWRTEVHAPALHWSSRAALQAQAWADQLQSEGCSIRHNPDPTRKKTYGENIYRYWRSSPYEGFRRDAKVVTDAWGAEKAYYDSAANDCTAPPGGMCGHYTQLVWSHSLEVGCGRAHCADSEVWVCNYFPRGNYVGLRPFDLAANAADATMAPSSVPDEPQTAPPSAP